MARPLRITYPGAFYHVTSRGNEGKVIFKNKRDRQKFLDYFESATQRYDAVFHDLIRLYLKLYIFAEQLPLFFLIRFIRRYQLGDHGIHIAIFRIC